MTIALRQFDACRTALALALAAAFGPAPAQTTAAEGSLSVGLGALDGNRAERAQFGQYNGLRTNGSVVGLFGVDYERRNAETGTTTRLFGTDLLLETRELGFIWKQQGNWKLGADYAEGVRREPYTVNTGLLGAGSATPQVVPLSAGTGSNFDLKIKRTSFGLTLAKSFSPNLELEVNLRSEDKNGARLFGIGMTCPSTVAPGCGVATGITTGSAVLLLPEPIDANHSQVEARLSHAAGNLRLSTGYYGSFYNNSIGALRPGVPGSLNNPVGTLQPLSTGLQSILNLPVALPPDNQAHHFDLTGHYAATPTTQIRFKLGYSQSLQHQDFAASGLADAPAGVANLGGRVDKTLLQVGVTSRPLPRLSLLADVRYEDRDDRTPIALYNIQGTSTYTNRRHPLERTRAKLQGTYQFSSAYRGTLGADFESIDRGLFTPSSSVSGISALRQKTDETGVRAELRRTMSETISGAIVVESRRRSGSNWLKPNSGLGVTEVPDPADPANGFGTTAIFDPSLANRRRDKVKLNADWQPTESLSLQLSAEAGRDRFRVPSSYGVESAGTNLVGVDWSYAWSEKWNLNGHVSHGTQRLHQSRPAGYILSYRNTNTSVGVGVIGKPLDRLEVGGGVTFFDDRNVYQQGLDAFAPPESVALLAATGGLPDVVFRQTTLKVFGRYDIDKSSAVRIDLLHQRSRVTDWAWGYNGVPFAYSDGTTLSQDPNQAVTFLGVTYIYRWR